MADFIFYTPKILTLKKVTLCPFSPSTQLTQCHDHYILEGCPLGFKVISHQ